MSIPTITLSGGDRTPVGTPLANAAGTIEFTLTDTLVDAADNVRVHPVVSTVTLSGGSFSVVLACTSGGDITPDGVRYKVIEKITGARERKYYIALPSSLGSTVNLADLVPIPGTPQATWTVPDLTSEQARDLVGTTLVAGAGITVTVDDPGDTVTVAAEVTQAELDTEAATRAAGDTALDARLDVIEALGPLATDAEVAAAIAALSGTYHPLGATGPAAKLPGGRKTTSIVDFGIAGHGWTANSNTASANLNDTSTFIRGTRSVSMTTKGDATVASIRNTALSSMNLTGKAFEISLMVEDWSKVASLYLYLGDTAFTNYRVLTLWNSLSALANGVSVKPADDGEWFTVTVDLSALESTTGTPNIAAVTAIQLGAKDTGSAAVVHWNHLAHFPAVVSPFPNGLVSFTFDDSYSSQYTVGRAALDKFGYKGTYYTIANLIGTAGYMTLTQLRLMQDVSGHEIAPHAATVANHNAVGGFTSLSAAALDAELRTLKQWMLTNGFRGRDHFAYPQGLRTLTAEGVVKRYFSSARMTLDDPVETSNPNHPLKLRTVRLNTPKTLVQAKADVDAAVANGSWVIFTIHNLPETLAGGAITEWLAQDFRDLVDYVATKTCAVRSIGDGLAEIGTTPADALAAMKTVDGTGSGLDADTVDGYEGATLVNGGQRILGRSYPTISPGIVNTTTETDLASFTVAAADAAASDVFELVIWGDGFNNSGGSVNFTPKVYVGASSVGAPAVSAGTGATRFKWKCVVEIHLATLATERVVWTWMQSFAGADDWRPWNNNASGQGVAALSEDFATSKVIRATMTMGTAASTIDIRPHGAVLKRLR